MTRKEKSCIEQLYKWQEECFNRIAELCPSFENIRDHYLRDLHIAKLINGVNADVDGHYAAIVLDFYRVKVSLEELKAFNIGYIRIKDVDFDYEGSVEISMEITSYLSKGYQCYNHKTKTVEFY